MRESESLSPSSSCSYQISPAIAFLWGGGLQQTPELRRRHVVKTAARPNLGLCCLRFGAKSGHHLYPLQLWWFGGGLAASLASFSSRWPDVSIINGAVIGKCAVHREIVFVWPETLKVSCPLLLPPPGLTSHPSPLFIPTSCTSLIRLHAK